jgi:replicative DNA helicase
MGAPRPVQQDPFFEKGLPCNLQVERTVLGSILLHNPVCNQAMELMRRDDLFLDSHRRIYDKMVALNECGSPIDLVTLSEELRRASEFEQVGGATYITSLIDDVQRTDDISYYVKILKSKSLKRKLITASSHIIALAYDEELEDEQLLDRAQQGIYAVVENNVRGHFRMAIDIAQEQMGKVQEIAGRNVLITGTSTGFLDFDQMTCGLQKQDLIIIAARPSCGKTSLALNIGEYAAKQGGTVGIFSLEMSGEQLVTRLISSYARIDAHRLRTGYLTRDEWARVATALGHLSEHKILIDDTPGITVSEMRAKARRLKAERGLDLLIVDYIQLISGHGKNENRTQEVSQISRDLKILAKELDVPCIALSQLSRKVEERSDHRPQLADLRESGSLEQDSDLVCFIYRDEVYGETDENRGRAEFIIAKQRNGPTGTVQVCFLKEYTRFENLWRDE